MCKAKYSMDVLRIISELDFDFSESEFDASDLEMKNENMVPASAYQSPANCGAEQICQGGIPAKDILVLPLDLMDRDSHEEKVKCAIQHFGNIHILINNAGRSQRSLCVDTSLDVYKAIMELNFLGTISLTKHILPHFLEMKKGLIVTINSVSGMAGVPLSSGYSASKHALQGFFNSLRTELADTPNIIISNVLPGPVQSDIVKNAFTEELGKRVPVMTDQSHKMSTQRCIHLILVAMANNLEEVWIADQPFLAVQYLWQYAPTWAWWITSKLGKRRVENFKRGLVSFAWLISDMIIDSGRFKRLPNCSGRMEPTHTVAKPRTRMTFAKELIQSCRLNKDTFTLPEDVKSPSSKQ
ncbi:DHRS7 reductase, partial [Polypterus senegalus]